MGIVLAVGGAGLYFLRSFKPALARDYDVFFAAIGLLCGGILFFQGWRLDPILQFGQFLLAGTTVFFAYESVRLRGVATDQARRSSYFEEDAPPARMSGEGLRQSWDDSYEQFEEPTRFRRRFSGRPEQNPDQSSQAPEDDFYRPRRTSRAAIPEEAASRRVPNRGEDPSWENDSEKARRMARFGSRDEEIDKSASFGQRRDLRQEQRRGTRPAINQQTSSRRGDPDSTKSTGEGYASSERRPGIPQGSPLKVQAEDAAFSPSRPRSSQRPAKTRSSFNESAKRTRDSGTGRSSPRTSRRRDNSSRFDD